MRLQRKTFFVFVAALLACAILVPNFAFAAAKAKQSSKSADAEPAYNVPHDRPWELRERYTIETGKAKFVYAADSGEWTLDVQGIGRVVESAGAELELADGTKFSTLQIGIATGTIKRLAHPMGDGIDYFVDFPPVQGLAVQHSLSMFNTRPFFLIRMKVKNVGLVPVDIRAIRPARFYVEQLSPSTISGVRNLQAHGPYLVPAGAEFPARVLLQDAERDFTLAVGFLPSQTVSTKTYLMKEPGRYHVEVASDFDPPVRLNPGETVESDAIWIALSTPRPSDIDLYYSWTQSQSLRPQAEDKIPRSWCTVSDGASMAELVHSAQTWSAAGVKHVLIPKTWESTTGSLVGGAHGFPREMGKAAAAFKSLSMTAGITVDPLTIEGGDAGWYVPSADNKRWLNLAKPEAKNYAVKRLRDTVGTWGFGFVVVPKSVIPDDVLRTQNLTRLQAESLSFAVLQEALPDIPVLPASVMTLKGDLSSWLAASGATSRLKEYGVGVGPVRFDAAGVVAPNQELLTAMVLYGGPIECIGECKDNVARALAPVMTSTRVIGRPLEAAFEPKVWHATFSSAQGEQDALVVFSGGVAREPAAWGLTNPMPVFAADSGQLLQSTLKRISPVLTKRPVGEEQIMAQLVEVPTAPTAEGINQSPKETPSADAPAQTLAVQTNEPAQDVTAPVASPPAASPSPAPPSVPREEIYTVVAGDTLSRIAARHKVTISDLRMWNNLTGDKILIGQKLRVMLPADMQTPDTPSTNENAPVIAETVPQQAIQPVEQPGPSNGVAEVHAGEVSQSDRSNGPVRKLKNWFKKTF